MSIFIINIGIIGPQSRFDCINFRASLVIEIINFYENFKMAHLTMFVIFYVDVIFCQNFKYITHLSHLCSKNSFFEMKIYKLFTWYPNMVHIMWNDMIQYTFNFYKYYKSFKLLFEYIYVFEYIGTLHLFSQIYSNLPLYKMKWKNFFFNILPRLYSNIICKNILNFFLKFEVGYIQTSTSLENSIMWYPKRDHHNVLSPSSLVFIQ
jgi:hypothetical protein